MVNRTSLRVALRTLGRHKGFTVVAVLSLGIAIALNTTMYSVLDAMLRPHINARNPENIWEVRFYANDYRKYNALSFERALAVKARAYESVTGAQRLMTSFEGSLIENGSRYKRTTVTVVRPNYFTFLGTQAQQGRLFAPYDSVSGTSNVVISDRLAAKLFPDASPIGSSITIDGNGYTVIGVVERSSVFYPLYGDLWILRPNARQYIPISFMRLRENVDSMVLRTELATISAQLAADAGEPVGTMGFYVKRYETRQFRIEGFTLALFGSVAAVLLVACANLANLQLARGLGRSRELALRSAVGASRPQLIQLLLIESGILALVGLALGVALTLWGAGIVRASLPPQITDYIIEPQTSWRVFAFAALAASVSLFLVGLVPAVQVSRVDPETLLKSGSGTGANRHHRRRYGLMVIAQIGFALPVLVGAVVVLKTAWLMHTQEFLIGRRYGYDPQPIVAGNLNFFSDTARVLRAADLASAFEARARATPGILEASTAYSLQPDKRMVSVDDENGVVREMPAQQWSYEVVSSSYMRTKNIQMREGRDFQPGELARSVIMDEGSAQYLWGKRNVVGRAIKFGDATSKAPWYRVVGVTRDLRDTASIRRADYSWGYRLTQVYRVMTPDDTINVTRRYFRLLTLYARVSGNTELAAVRLQRAIRTSAGLEHTMITPLLDDWVGFQQTRQDFVAGLFTVFALLGISLVAIGVYGIVAHTVAERKRELAVRISLGATVRNVLHSVLREGNVLVLAGVACGLLISKYTVWWVSVFMQEDFGYDAILFAMIASGLFAIAGFAALIPAWRATRIDPVEALRHE